ncbi:MAG TPA: SRPBCC domain-containing protein, partial [Acidimicrobiia bacterium]|nr:SRPBCC domain-containing protein [Acidimicrobiia bacterium]
MAGSVTVERKVGAPPFEVYRYFTKSTLIAEWLCDVALATAHPGGRVYFGWNDGAGVVGNFTELQPGEKVGFTWSGTGIPGPGEVAIV